MERSPESYGVATNNNRVNSQNRPARSNLGKTSQRLTNIIPAGGFLPLPCSGTFFYVLLASGPLLIKPSGGIAQEYSTGTGLDIEYEENAFQLLELQNNNAYPVAFEIFVGWDAFIDKRLILVNNSSPQVAYPTYPVANAATHVAIDDLSGQAFTDINGNEWYALSRVAICIGNPDSGVTLLLQAEGAATASGPSVLPIYPQTSLRLDISGNYSLDLGGATINAIVSEIYNVIPKLS